MKQIKLSRSISFPKLLFYWLWTMVWGGFYALLGEIAGFADMLTPLAFLLAGLIALVNAFTYGELSSRYPYSAWEFNYVDAAFKNRSFSIFIALLVVLTWVVSAATLSVATIWFLSDFISFPESLWIIVLVFLMWTISAWWMSKSMWAILLITFIELWALLFIVIIAWSNLVNISEITSQLSGITSDTFLIVWILSGAFLWFYAFLGFEDMANMAEEVKDARKTLPKAMILSIILTTLIYVVVSSIAVLTVSPDELHKATTPLAKIVESAGTSSIIFITVVSILTGINWALVQIIMASRVFYGVGKKSKKLKYFSSVNKKTKTPIRATILASVIVLWLALFFPLITLAQLTSTIILIVFSILNLALIKIKIDIPNVSNDIITYPFWVPVLGFIVCISMLGFRFLL